MRTLFLPYALAAACSAQTPNPQTLRVDASQITATQAVLTYTAPSASACTLQVSQSSTFAPLVHDVNTSLFGGSNLDSRPGSTANGLRRSFVVGTRRSDQAADGKLYSRALQAATTHYYRLSCGPETATGQFATANPPLGNTFPEPMPFNPAGWGNYGWPTIDWNDKTRVYIDPLTGIAIKRMTGPGEVRGHVHGYGWDSAGIFSSYVDLHGAWTHAQNIVGNGAAPSQAVVAGYSGANRDPIFVAWGPGGLPEGFSTFNPEPGYGLVSILDNVQLAIFGTGTDASPENRTVEVCLSFYDSGATCNTRYYPVILPTSAPRPSSKASAVYPASGVFPDGGAWQGWGTIAKRNDISVSSGTFSATGTTVTLTTCCHQAEFNLNWRNGGRIHMEGSAPACPKDVCTILSVTDGAHLEIAERLPSAIRGKYYSLTSGAVVRKATAIGAVELSVSSAYSESAGLISANGGDHELCSRNPVTVSYAADGVSPITPVSGEFCLPFVTTAPVLYLLIPSTGETRYLSPVYIDTHSTARGPEDLIGTGTGIASWTSGSFDPAIANRFAVSYRYSHSQTIGRYINQAANSVVQATYTSQKKGCTFKAYAHSLYTPPSWSNGQDTTESWFQGPMWRDSCMSYDNSKFLPSQHKDLDSRIVMNSPSWKNSMQSASGTGIQIAAIRWGKTFAGSNPGGQDTATGLWVFDNASGNLEFSSASLNGAFPQRWGVNHTTNIGTPANTFGINNQIPKGNMRNGNPKPDDYGRGPFRFTPSAILKSGSFTSDTSIPAANSILGACPSGIPTFLVQQGATGNNCITFQSQMACSAAPYWPYAGHTELADAAGPAATALAVASMTGISVGTYLYIETPDDATPFPGLELVYVQAFGAASLTVVRSVNGVSTPLRAGAKVSIMRGSQSPEAADYPCDHGPVDVAGRPLWSEPSPIQPGDVFNYWGQLNTYGEWEDWQIVSVTPLTENNYQFVASRSPTSEGNYCVMPGITNKWPSGWSGYMIPLCDANNFVNTTKLSAGWSYNFVGGGHAAFGYGGSSPYGTVTQSSDSDDPYQVTYQKPIMSPRNPFLANEPHAIASSVPFAGYAPSYSWQSYPSQLQFASSDPLAGRWLVDLHALNPGGGTSQGSGDAIKSNFSPGSRVAGAKTVWKFTGGHVPYKIMPVMAYAGYHLLQDVSSPAKGDVITDGTPWKFCYAYKPDECRTASAAGEVYMSVPQAGGTTSSLLGQCFSNWFDEDNPCAVNLQFHGASIVQGAIDQPDITGQSFRKITTGFMGPGREFSFSAATTEPTGRWTIFSCNWCDGYRSDLFIALLPPFPAERPAKNVRNGFVDVDVKLAAEPAYDQARVRFGYGENGDPANFYCTQRADACMTSNAVAPFAFVSEGAAWTPCSSGCTLSVPAIPGRVLYYAVDRKNASSGTVSTSETHIAVNP